jgi:hypothetical protein
MSMSDPHNLGAEEEGEEARQKEISPVPSQFCFADVVRVNDESGGRWRSCARKSSGEGLEGVSEGVRTSWFEAGKREAEGEGCV